MKNNILSKIFVFWILLSIGLLCYFYEEEQTKILCLAVMGQLFFVIGLIASIATITSKKEHYNKYWVLIFPIIGLGLIITSVGNYFNIDFIKKNCIILIPLGMILLGIILLINNIQNKIRKKKYCTYEVIGKIVGTIKQIKRDIYNKSSFVRYPVYEFYYQSIPYLVSRGNLYNTKKEDLDECNDDYPKGEIRELMINPDNPYEWEYKHRSKFWIAFDYIIPFINIIVGIILIYMFSKMTGLL